MFEPARLGSKKMRMKWHCETLGLILVLALVRYSQAEPCREFHGRAILYSGDSFLEIWHIGTHHTFFVVDNKSTELILKYIPDEGDEYLKELFAEFTICPTARYRKGASQPMIVKGIQHPRVVLDPRKSGR